jgi:hypothetical protein
MTHLTAATWATNILHPLTPRFGVDRPGRKHGFSDSTVNGCPAPVESVFRSCMRNFVEMPDAGPHYSVIDQYASVLPGSYVGRRPLNDEVSASDAGAAAPADCANLFNLALPKGGFILCLRTRSDQMTLQDPSGQSELRTGIAKTHTDEWTLPNRMHVDVTIANIRMMRIDEKIHATHPPCATVAPILHKLVDARATDRGTTLNKGAAA